MDSVFYRRCFFVATALLLGFALVRVLEPLGGPLLWAAFLAFLVQHLHARLTRRLRGRAGWSAGILTALMPVCILAPLALLGVLFAQQAAMLIDYWRTNPLQIDMTLVDRAANYPVIGPLVRWVRENLAISTQQLQEWAIGGAQTALKHVATLSGNAFLGAVGTLVGFIFMLFLFFFLVRDGRALLARGIRLIPMETKRRDDLVEHLGSVMLAVVFGTALTALIQGALVGIGFAIAGLPSPVVFGVVAAIAAFLPALGTGAVLVPGIAWLMIQGRWGAAIFLGLWALGVGFSDNVLRPILVARHAPVSSLAVFVGVVGGVAAFGFIGIIAGPVLLSLISALLRFLENVADGSARG